MPQSIPTLQELAFMYGTDKAEHGYMDFYEKHLPKSPKKILEIGVKEGRSIRTWLKYFPEVVVHGLDLFKEFPVPFQDERVKWYEGSQTDQYILEQLRRENFDCIIEDASHDCRKHWITLFGLIDSCGQYYIEDLHTCEDSFFSEGLKYEHTIKGAVKAGKIPFDCILSENENIVLIKQ
jgi:hypothetical protein